MSNVRNANFTTLILAACMSIMLAGCGTAGSSPIGQTGALVASVDAARAEMGGHGMMGLFARLNLTDAQKTQAQAIFDAERTDVKALRDQAHSDIRNLLTTDQQAVFDTLPQPRGPGMGPPHGIPGPHMGGMNGSSRCGMGGPPPTGTDGTPPDPATMRQQMVDRLATILSLTDDQKAQVLTILTDTDTAIEARRQQAKDDFRAILTADQIAILDQIEAEHQEP